MGFRVRSIGQFVRTLVTTVNSGEKKTAYSMDMPSGMVGQVGLKTCNGWGTVHPTVWTNLGEWDGTIKAIERV